MFSPSAELYFFCISLHLFAFGEKVEGNTEFGVCGDRPTFTGRTRSLEDHVFFACGSGEGTLLWFPIVAEGDNGEPQKKDRSAAGEIYRVMNDCVRPTLNIPVLKLRVPWND